MGYRVGFDEHWAGVITDIGHVSDGVLDKMRSLSMMAFEFNHDVDMLMYGDYPDLPKNEFALIGDICPMNRQQKDSKRLCLRDYSI